MEFYVYVHRKGTTNEVFYVGKGIGKRAYSKTSRSKYWHNIVNKYGYKVEIICSGLQEWYAFELETELINLHGRVSDGSGPLINFTDGGEGSSGRVLSQETRNRIAMKAIGRVSKNKGKSGSYKHSELSREKIRKGNIGKKRSEETRARMSEANRKKRHSEETKSKLRDLKLERLKDPEYKKKISRAGSTQSIETREKISRTLTGRKMPTESCMKISLANSDNNIYCLVHSGGEQFTGTRRQFLEKYNVNIKPLFRSTPSKISHGWRLQNE